MNIPGTEKALISRPKCIGRLRRLQLGEALWVIEQSTACGCNWWACMSWVVWKITHFSPALPYEEFIVSLKWISLIHMKVIDKNTQFYVVVLVEAQAKLFYLVFQKCSDSNKIGLFLASYRLANPQRELGS